MKKYIFKVLLIVISIFAININAKAEYKVVSSFPNSIKSFYDGFVNQDGTQIYNKGFDNTGRAFCTWFWNDFKETTCTSTWWSNDYNTESNASTVSNNRKIAAAVGAMINKARNLSSGSGSIDRDVYFYTEVAINHFLYNYRDKASVNNVSRLKNWSSISNRETFKAIYSAGTAAYDDFGKTRAVFSNPNINIENNSLSVSAKLTCYDAKGNKIRCSARCKQTISLTIEYNGGSKTYSVANGTGKNADCPKNSNEMSYNYNKTFTSADLDNIDISSITKVTVDFDTKNYTSYPVAQEYYCGSSSYQNLTPNMIKTYEMPYEASTRKVKAQNIPQPCSITLKKYAGAIDSSSLLQGAVFELYDSGGNKISSSETDGNGEIVFSDLVQGTNYTLKEVKAPVGYVLNDTPRTVSCNNQTEKFSNTPEAKGSLTIKKEDGQGNAVAGATIRLYKITANGTPGSISNDNEHDNAYDGDYPNTDNGSHDTYELISEFVTTSEPKVFGNLDLNTTYYVEEESVPSGSDYAIKVSSDSIKIIEAKNYEVTLINVHSNFKISKQDITSKKELPGAEIVITDIYGNEIEKWTSTEVPHEIKGLADGEYILTEITAPKGYKKAESIRFTIENGKLKDDPDNTLVMYDDTSIFNIPDTLSARNILIVLSGMAIVAAGIGVFLYGVKRKDQV